MPIKILLLNPPGRQVYIRDYYCSKVSKSNYLFHPVDLLMLSGRISEHYPVHVIDAMADGLTEAALLQRIDELAPDVVIAMIGAVSLEEDRAFLAKLKKTGRRIAVSGDIVLENAEEWLRRNTFIDAALLDFTSGDITHFVEGSPGPFEGLATRNDAPQADRRPRALNQEFTLPVPRHDLFTSRHYRFPFVRHRAFATVLTDYGCPYSCTFCNMSKLGYKYRPVENVLDELRVLKALGKKEVFFIDQTFGVSRSRTLELCARMKEEGLSFGWACFSRVDLLTEDLLTAMQQAGCHTLMLGVETASPAVLEKYRKGYTKAQIREAFKLCKARKIRTVATFIMGLPEETEETARETMRFSKELGCDFASFNIAVPRIGTPFRQEAIRECLVLPDLEIMDQTGASIAMPTRHLTKEQVKKIRNRAIMHFYLRPGYLWRRAAAIASFYELSEQLSEGWALLRSLWRKENAGSRPNAH